MKQAYPTRTPITVNNTVVTFIRTKENPFNDGKERIVTTCRIAIDNPKYPRAVATGTAYKHPNDIPQDADGQRIALKRAIHKICVAASFPNDVAWIIHTDDVNDVYYSTEKQLFDYFRRKLYEACEGIYFDSGHRKALENSLNNAMKEYASMHKCYERGLADFDKDVMPLMEKALDAQKKLDQFIADHSECICDNPNQTATCARCNALGRLRTPELSDVT